MYVCTHIYIYMYVLTYVYIYICMYVWTYVFMCVCMYVCTREYTYAKYISDRHIFQTSKGYSNILEPRTMTSPRFHTETCQNSVPP